MFEVGRRSVIDPKDVTRYVRPEDIPLLDRTILEPIVTSAAREMARAFAGSTVEQWTADIQRALIKGELLIVIDDRQKRVGLVRTDQPPFLGVVSRGEPVSLGPGGSPPDDPLGIKAWGEESGAPPVGGGPR